MAKEEIGLEDGEKIRPGGYEAMCNPVGQAVLLNDSGCEFNIVLGLCVGHDSLFFRHSEGPVTVLVAKDRVLAHNPIGASTWPTATIPASAARNGRRRHRSYRWPAASRCPACATIRLKARRRALR